MSYPAALLCQQDGEASASGTAVKDGVNPVITYWAEYWNSISLTYFKIVWPMSWCCVY